MNEEMLQSSPCSAIDETALEARERRQYKRAAVIMNASLIYGERRLKGLILNASVHGVKLQLQEPLELGARITLIMAGSVHFGGKVVWRKGNAHGIHFTCHPRLVAEVMAGILPADCLEIGAA